MHEAELLIYWSRSRTHTNQQKYMPHIIYNMFMASWIIILNHIKDYLHLKWSRLDRNQSYRLNWYVAACSDLTKRLNNNDNNNDISTEMNIIKVNQLILFIEIIVKLKVYEMIWNAKNYSKYRSSFQLSTYLIWYTKIIVCPIPITDEEWFCDWCFTARQHKKVNSGLPGGRNLMSEEKTLKWTNELYQV